MDLRKIAYPSLATTRTAVTMTYGDYEVVETVLPESDDMFFFIRKGHPEGVEGVVLVFVGHWCARTNEGVVYSPQSSNE